jgi:hypothetical protein
MVRGERMAWRRRVIFGTVFACLVLGLAVLAAHDALARPPAADFEVPMSARQAKANVREAQAQAASLRATEQLGVDAADLPQALTVYFPQSGHHLSNRSGFLDFWRANGQVLIFGYPISEEFPEDGRIVQYFERARFELHPGIDGGPGRVQLGLVGREVYAQFGGLPPAPDPGPGAFFAETNHAIAGEFLRYWQRRGGLERFGFPIGPELLDNGRIVQYFERARFEYHPEDMPGFFRGQERYTGYNLDTLFEVRLSDVGRQAAVLRGIDTTALPQREGTLVWSPSLWARHIDVNLSTQWLTAYEDGLVVWRAPVATGRDGFNTPVGDFAIYYRLPMQTMNGCIGGECWNVPNIPWVQYVVGGVALHGTYWHDAHGSGVRMSHGCINLRIDDAQWLYEWADIGTTVSIHH